MRRAGPPEGPIRSRWQKQEIAQWRRVPPEMVCEVVFSNVDVGRRFRHAATLLRWRPDLSAADCRVEQLTRF
ncbi:MAG: hypothetical protein M3069_22815 [Chloroflexota bacterium]|nr:hypothetical protein [Chloroflexota bacterium]